MYLSLYELKFQEMGDYALTRNVWKQTFLLKIIAVLKLSIIWEKTQVRESGMKHSINFSWSLAFSNDSISILKLIWLWNFLLET